jgi:hypothetical protein
MFDKTQMSGFFSPNATQRDIEEQENGRNNSRLKNKNSSSTRPKTSGNQIIT